MAAPDVKSTLVVARIDSAVTTSKALHSGMSSHVAGQKGIKYRYTALEAKLKEAAANEPSADLQTALFVLASATANVEKVREEVLCSRHDDLILKELSEYYASSYKPAKRMVVDRDNTIKKRIAAETKKAKMVHDGKTAGPDFEKASLDILSHLQREENVDFMFVENAQLWELKRLRDHKRMLSEYVAAQIAFHAKAIENLSAAAEALGAFDPDKSMDILGSALAGQAPPRTPEEASPASYEHARTLTESLPETALLPKSAAASGAPRFEAGGMAPTRGVSFAYHDGGDEEGIDSARPSPGVTEFKQGSGRSTGSAVFAPDDPPAPAPAPGPAPAPTPAAGQGGAAAESGGGGGGFFSRMFGGKKGQTPAPAPTPAPAAAADGEGSGEEGDGKAGDADATA